MAQSNKVLLSRPDELVLEKFFNDYIVPWYQERVVNVVTYQRARKEIDLLKQKSRKKQKSMDEEKPSVVKTNIKGQNEARQQTVSKTEVDSQHVLFENAKYKKMLSEMEEEMCEIKAQANIDLRQKDHQLEKLRMALENTKAQVDEKTIRLREGKSHGERIELATLTGPKSQTELAKFSEIYDCEWSEAYENIPVINEEKKIRILHGIVQGSFAFCQQTIKKQNQTIETVILAKDNEEQSQKSASMDVQFTQAMNDLRIQLSTDTAKNVAQDFTTNVVQIILSGFGINRQKVNQALKKYAFKCAEICWLLLVHYPQVSLSNDIEDEPFDQDTYLPYTKRLSEFDQPTTEFCVWPALCRGSSVLVKGVAQPNGVKRRKPLDLQR